MELSSLDSIRFQIGGKLNIDYCASLSLADIEGIYLGGVQIDNIYWGAGDRWLKPNRIRMGDAILFKLANM